MNDARPWTHAALFGAVWGALELSLGTVLKLGRLPLSGLIMTLLGLACLVTLRRLQPVPGICLLAGVSAATLKVLALGGFYPGPVIGIVVEAAVVELAMDVAGGRPGAILAGALAAAADPIQMLIMVRVVAGAEAVHGYARAGMAVLGSVGLHGVTPVQLLAALVAAVAVAGAAGGALSWRIAARVARRLGVTP
ncbi:MAG TPA: hypothetical protein ENK19_09130 [Acidobacteria bacterium]|nr:hypothetical protein [Acidobacteriota bacterium]